MGDFSKPPVEAPTTGGATSSRPDPDEPTIPNTPPANAEADAKAKKLRDDLKKYSSLTFKTIRPLGSLDEIRAKTAEYRELVNGILRQPFLRGGAPGEKLEKQIRDSHQRWNELAGSIRAGRKPATLPAAALRKAQGDATSSRDNGEVRVTGKLWADLSDAYFASLAAIEASADQEASTFRDKRLLTELAHRMAEVENKLREVEANPAQDHPLQRHQLSWLLYQVWRLGARVHMLRLLQERAAVADLGALDNFWGQMEATRNLRARASLLPDGEGPVMPDAAVPVEAAPGETVRARLGTADTEVPVVDQPPSRLPQLAAALYHTHAMIARAEQTVAEDDRAELEAIREERPSAERNKRERELLQGQAARVEEVRKFNGERRAQLLNEIKEEADRP